VLHVGLLGEQRICCIKRAGISGVALAARKMRSLGKPASTNVAVAPSCVPWQSRAHRTSRRTPQFPRD
jgi:hypothetical protein